jgi:hypothetical protein
VAGRSIGTVAARALGGFLTLLDRTNLDSLAGSAGTAALRRYRHSRRDESRRSTYSVGPSPVARAPEPEQNRCADMGLPISGGKPLGEPSGASYRMLRLLLLALHDPSPGGARPDPDPQRVGSPAGRSRSHAVTRARRR